MSFIYVATQYTKHPRGTTVAYVEALGYASRLMSRHVPVFSPIGHTHPIDTMFDLTHSVSQFDWVKDMDFPILKHAAAVLVVMAEGWATSHGIAREIEFAEEHDIPVVYRTPSSIDDLPTIRLLNGYVHTAPKSVYHPEDIKNQPEATATVSWEAGKLGEQKAAGAASLNLWNVAGLSRTGLSSGENKQTPTEGVMRRFASGATRDADTDKHDYEGFLSPSAMAAFGRYMHKHRRLPDGTMRASDNWQAGIPLTAYVKSLWRHLLEVWTLHRKPTLLTQAEWDAREDALCAILFNAQGYLHEVTKSRPPPA